MKLHESQKKLLNFLKNVDSLDGLSYWDIARETGLTNAQNVIHHLKQLERFGYLRRDPSNPDSFELLKDPIEDVVYLPVYGFAHCGNKSEFFFDNNTKEKVAVSTTLLGISNPKNYFMVRAKGDSMSPNILENDLVICDERKDVESGNVAILIHKGQCKIKQIFKTTKGIILKSFNPTHPDVLVAKTSDIQILGLARQVIHHL